MSEILEEEKNSTADRSSLFAKSAVLKCCQMGFEWDLKYCIGREATPAKWNIFWHKSECFRSCKITTEKLCACENKVSVAQRESTDGYGLSPAFDGPPLKCIKHERGKPTKPHKAETIVIYCMWMYDIKYQTRVVLMRSFKTNVLQRQRSYVNEFLCAGRIRIIICTFAWSSHILLRCSVHGGETVGGCACVMRGRKSPCGLIICKHQHVAYGIL